MKICFTLCLYFHNIISEYIIHIIKSKFESIFLNYKHKVYLKVLSAENTDQLTGNKTYCRAAVFATQSVKQFL